MCMMHVNIYLPACLYMCYRCIPYMPVYVWVFVCMCVCSTHVYQNLINDNRHFHLAFASFLNLGFIYKGHVCWWMVRSELHAVLIAVHISEHYLVFVFNFLLVLKVCACVSAHFFFFKFLNSNCYCSWCMCVHQCFCHMITFNFHFQWKFEKNKIKYCT